MKQRIILWTFLYMLLAYAIVHVALKIIMAIVSGSLLPFQFFKVLELDYFFPVLVQDPLWHVVSVLGTAVFVLIGYLFARNHTT